jgi:UDP-glucose 4-epimerase
MFEVEAPFDCVIHFAGFKAVGESVAQPLKYYENNVLGTLTLLQAMHKYGCKTMVFSSSATVYLPSEQPLDECAPLGCTNPYGHSKRMVEQMLQDQCRADPDWKVEILRYFNPVGAHDSGLIGEDPLDVPNNLLPYIQQVGVGRRPYLNLFGDDYPTTDGSGVRDYLHVMDLADAHVGAVAYLARPEVKGCNVHNLGTGRGVSV